MPYHQPSPRTPLQDFSISRDALGQLAPIGKLCGKMNIKWIVILAALLATLPLFAVLKLSFYPEQSQLGDARGRTGMDGILSIQNILLSGSGEEALNNDLLQTILRSINPVERFVSIVVVPEGRASLAVNWACWWMRASNGDVNVMFAVFDEDSYETLHSAQLPVVLAQAHGSVLNDGSALLRDFISSDHFSKLLTVHQVTVMLTDVHMVWFTDFNKFANWSHSDMLTIRESEDVSSSLESGDAFADDMLRSRAPMRSPMHLVAFRPSSAMLKCLAALELQNNLEYTPRTADTADSLRLLKPCTRVITKVIPRNALAGIATIQEFVQDAIPQKWGILSAALWTDAHMSSVSIEEQLRSANMWMMAEDGSTCSAAPVKQSLQLLPTPRGASVPDVLLIRVITCCRPKSLERLLASLNAADYGVDSGKIQLQIGVDKIANTTLAALTDDVIGRFVWKHGSMDVFRHATNQGLVGQWMTIGDGVPRNKKLAWFVLEDDIELSTFYYSYLKLALQKYYLDDENRDPQMFGVSLQDMNSVFGPTISVINSTHGRAAFHQVGKTVPWSSPHFRYQCYSSWAVALFSEQWFLFRDWYARKVELAHGDPGVLNVSMCVPWFKTNELAQERYRDHVWSPYFSRFLYEYGLYGMFCNSALRANYATNYRESGVNYKRKYSNPTNGLITTQEEHERFAAVLAPAAELPLYDRTMALTSAPGELTYRPLLVEYPDMKQCAMRKRGVFEVV